MVVLQTQVAHVNLHFFSHRLLGIIAPELFADLEEAFLDFLLDIGVKLLLHVLDFQRLPLELLQRPVFTYLLATARHLVLVNWLLLVTQSRKLALDLRQLNVHRLLLFGWLVNRVLWPFALVLEIRKLAVLRKLVLALEAVWRTHVVAVADFKAVLGGLLFDLLLFAHNAVAPTRSFLARTVRMRKHPAFGVKRLVGLPLFFY